MSWKRQLYSVQLCLELGQSILVLQQVIDDGLLSRRARIGAANKLHPSCK